MRQGSDACAADIERRTSLASRPVPHNRHCGHGLKSLPTPTSLPCLSEVIGRQIASNENGTLISFVALFSAGARVGSFRVSPRREELSLEPFLSARALQERRPFPPSLRVQTAEALLRQRAKGRVCLVLSFPTHTSRERVGGEGEEEGRRPGMTTDD